MFITNNGELWSCGSNKSGQLGLAVDDESEEEKS
jgi:alpha-tubulin suppressor-like RCC1 family protein